MPVKVPFSTDSPTGKSEIKGPGTKKSEKSVLGYTVAALFQNPNWVSNPVTSKLGNGSFSKCPMKLATFRVSTDDSMMSIAADAKSALELALLY